MHRRRHGLLLQFIHYVTRFLEFLVYSRLFDDGVDVDLKTLKQCLFLNMS